MVRKIIALAVLVLLCHPQLGTAEEHHYENYNHTFTVGVFTYHFNSERANNVNRLVGYTYKGFTVAEFNNSYNDETVFVGYRYEFERLRLTSDMNWYGSAGLYVGAVYGYEDHIPVGYKGVSPFALPFVTVGYDRYAMDIGFVPLPGKNGMVTVMLKYSF